MVLKRSSAGLDDTGRPDILKFRAVYEEVNVAVTRFVFRMTPLGER